MNKTATKFLKIILLVAGISFSGVLLADDPPPPPPPGSHGSTGNQSPMGAPVDGGLSVFLAFAAAYAGREYFKKRQIASEEK